MPPCRHHAKKVTCADIHNTDGSGVQPFSRCMGSSVPLSGSPGPASTCSRICAWRRKAGLGRSELSHEAGFVLPRLRSLHSRRRAGMCLNSMQEFHVLLVGLGKQVAALAVPNGLATMAWAAWSKASAYSPNWVVKSLSISPRVRGFKELMSESRLPTATMTAPSLHETSA